MPSTKAIKVLYCCSDSDKDEQMRQQLEEHLSFLKRDGVIATWDKSMISAGKEWENEINMQLQTADIILPLISSKFIASDYNWNVLAKGAMERHRDRKARVVPILLRPVDTYWKVAFPKVKALPEGERPITEWRPYDKAFANIAQGIRVVAEEVTGSPFPIKKSLRQIMTVVMPVAKAFFNMATVTVNVASATFSSLPRARYRRRNKVNIRPLVIVAGIGTIFLVPQLPKLLRNPSSESNQTPNQTLSPTRNIIPIGWIRIGVVNNTSGSLSVGERLLQTSEIRLAPSIDSPVVPSIGAVVTVKNPVNLRENRPQTYNSDLPEKVGLLKPKEKLIILQLQHLVNPDSNSSRIEIWAQVSKCQRACDK